MIKKNKYTDIKRVVVATDSYGWEHYYYLDNNGNRLEYENNTHYDKDRNFDYVTFGQDLPQGKSYIFNGKETIVESFNCHFSGCGVEDGKTDRRDLTGDINTNRVINTRVPSTGILDSEGNQKFNN